MVSVGGEDKAARPSSSGPQQMGWGIGSAKKEILDPAAGDLVRVSATPRLRSSTKRSLIDLSGWAHIGSKARSEARSRSTPQPLSSRRVPLHEVIVR